MRRPDQWRIERLGRASRALLVATFASLALEASAAPRLGVSPAALELSTASGTTATASLTLSNTGDAPLTVRVAARSVKPDPGGLRPGDSLARVAAGEGGVIPDRKQASRATRPWAEAGSRRWATVAPSARVSLTGVRALILHAGGVVGPLRQQLLAFPEFAAVEEHDLSFGTPSLAQLEPYDCVLMAVTSPAFDPDLTGDVLADYVDGGGGLVLTIASFIRNYEVRGRLLAGGYIPFLLGGTGGGSGHTLGAHDSTHAIMAGIRDLAGDIIAVVSKRETAAEVARWEDGQLLVATLPRVAAINLFVALPGYAGAQAMELLRNALVWSVGQVDWIRIPSAFAIVPPGAQAVLEVELDATDRIAGTYTAELELVHDDPAQDDVRVPVRLSVTGEPRLRLTAGRLVLTSQEIFSLQGQETGHRIVVPQPYPETLRVELIAEGDFGNTGEVATLTVEGVQLLGVGETGTDCTAAAHSTGAGRLLVSRWLEDGIVDVRVRNAEFVDPLCPTNRHTVRLHFERPGDIVRFPAAFVGNTSESEVVFENTGAEALHVRDLHTDLAAFKLEQDTLSVAPRASRALRIRFRPAVLGATRGSLTFATNDPTQPTASALLEGTGLPPPDVDATPLAVDVRLAVGGTATRQVTIRNTGISPLVFQLRARGAQRAAPGPREPRPAHRPQPPPAVPATAVGSEDVPLSHAPPTLEDSHVPRSGEAGALPMRPTGRSVVPGARVLILQDAEPWGLQANENVLSGFGVAFDMATSAELDTLDLGRYRLVLIPSDQPSRAYARIGDHFEKLEDFVGGGGVLEVHAAGWGFNLGDATLMRLPGGVLPERQPSDVGHISLTDHPLAAGVPTQLPGTSSSHAWLRGLPDHADVVAFDEFGQPVLAVWSFGHGTVVATGLTVEYAHVFGQAAGPLLANMLRYSIDAWPHWLSFQPSGGVVPPGQSLPITLTFQTDGMYAGDHAAELDVLSEDPDEPRFPVAVHLHVDGAPNLQVQARTVSGTSRTRYVVNGARTSHRFPVVRPSGTSLTLDFEVFGDYNNLGEEATLFLEGVRIGSLGALGGDCVLGRTSFFLPPSFADFLLADGVVEVSVQNSTNVDPSCPSNEHIVRLSYVETPFPLRFRDTFVGGSDQRGFHVRNSGTAPLTLRGIVPGDAQFRASPTTGVILPRHELLVMGEFRPQAAGTFLATMRIQSDDPDAPEIGLMFQGRSLAAPALDVALGEITADLVAGEILTREVALRNLGGSTLEARWLAVSDWHAPAGRLPGLAALAAEGEPPLPPPGGPPLSDGMDSASPLAKAPAPLPTLASARARVLIVEDFAPWGRLTNELLLDSLGMPYDRVTSAEFETHDLSPYSLVILPSDQTDLYYVRMHAHGAKLAAWVEQGGVLDAHLAAWGSNIGEGSLMIIPGGTHAQASLDIRNRLAVPRHPLVAGLADPFEGTYASHGVLLDLPQDALVVTRNMSGAPTLATYRLGAGLVIASTHPYEYGLNNDQPTGRVLLNLLPFAMAGSGQWLRAAPERMSVGPAGAALARFTLDATGLEPGEYAGSLQLTTNDPLATWRAFPVSVRVADVRGTLEVAGDALDPSERRRKLDVRLRLPSGHRRSRVRVESVRLNGVPAVPTRSHDSEDDDEEGDDDLAAGGEAPGAPGAALAPADGAGHGRHGTHVRLRFDRAAVLATLPDSCRGELLLTGALAGGGRFLARDSVRCVERRDRDDDDLVAGGAGAASAVAAVPASPSLRLGPNPMLAAGTLRLELALPRAGPVEVQVFSLDGRLVRDVAVGERAAGTHGLAWDGRDRAGRLTPAGVYLVRVRAPGFAISRRVVRVR